MLLNFQLVLLSFQLATRVLPHHNEEMCNKALDNYPHGLEFVPECYRTQKMRDKALNAHSSTIQFVHECYKTQEMCDKAFHQSFLAFTYIPD